MNRNDSRLKEPFQQSPEIRRGRLLALLTLAAWTLLVGVSLYWNTSALHRNALHSAKIEALANLNKDLTFRRWVASHGGVYVPIDKRTPPNPYLHIEGRDVKTTDGRRLTLMNPAYALRQLNEMHADRFGISGKITSLKLFNPNNAPDAWEIGALNRFEAGERVHSEVVEENGKPVLRTMIALLIEPECMKCHARQGYKVGDVRGGLDTKIDLGPYLAGERELAYPLMLTHAAIWLVVCIAIYSIYRKSLLRRFERLKYTLALQDSRLLFKTIADFSNTWIFWRNPDGSLRYNSPSCETISGYSAEELTARPELISEMIHPDDRDFWDKHRHEADAERSPNPLEFRIRTKGGELRWVAHSCRPIYDESGQFLGVRGSNTDITERRSRDDLLKAQSRHAAMGEMVKNIAHQWRQPLTTLGLIMQNLRQDHRDGLLNDEQIDAYARDAQQLIAGMSTTIDDFRNFFRPNKERQPFSLKKAVAGALNLMGAAFTSHGIEVRTHVPADLMLSGYPNEFAQVLLNLLANAKDAIVDNAVPHGLIEISAGREDGAILLRIRNNGGDIPNEALERLFQPYFTTKPDGTGIGLYMSRMLIEQGLGGTIAVANTGKGAEFTIRCPLALGVST